MMEFLAANFNLPTIIVSILCLAVPAGSCIMNTRPAASAAVTAPAGAAAAAVTAAAQVIVRPAAVPATVSKA